MNIQDIVLTFEASDSSTSLGSLVKQHHGSDAHAFRASWLAHQLGQHLNWSDAAVRQLTMAARFHDIGKCALPAELLEQSDPLSASQVGLIQIHAEMGAHILVAMHAHLGAGLRACVEGALFHHERWDGFGYPRRLKGTEIPLVARVISVVDVFDALLSVRPYKKAWLFERAVAYIVDQSGSHFDPAVVQAFGALIDTLPSNWVEQALLVQRDQLELEWTSDRS